MHGTLATAELIKELVADSVRAPIKLAHLAQRHDIVAVRLYDRLEMDLPDLGLLAEEQPVGGPMQHRQADREHQQDLAEARARLVREALESFAMSWYKRRAIHIYRDETDLAANPGLWPRIEVALS